MIEVCWGKSSPKLKHYIMENDIENVSKSNDIYTSLLIEKIDLSKDNEIDIIWKFRPEL